MASHKVRSGEIKISTLLFSNLKDDQWTQSGMTFSKNWVHAV